MPIPAPRAITVIEHEIPCPPGRLSTIAESEGIALHVIRPHLGDPIPTLPQVRDASAGLVVLGGGMGPFDDATYSWLAPCRELLRDAIRGSFPTFGICLGEELLAAAIGAPLTRRPQPEVGLCRVFPTPDDKHTADVQDPLWARIAELSGADGALFFQWHQEQVSVLPSECEGHRVVLNAVDADGGIQGFRVGANAWGVQFHPEITVDIAHGWATTSKLTPANRTADSFAAEVRQWEASPRHTPGELILRAFMEQCIPAVHATDRER